MILYIPCTESTFLLKIGSLSLRNSVVTMSSLKHKSWNAWSYHIKSMRHTLDVLVMSNAHKLVWWWMTYWHMMSGERLSLDILLRWVYLRYNLRVSMCLIGDMRVRKIMRILRRHEDWMFLWLSIVFIDLLLLLLNVSQRILLLLLLSEDLLDLKAIIGNICMVRLQGFSISPFRRLLLNLLCIDQWSKVICWMSKWIWVGVGINNFFRGSSCELT